MREPCGGLLSVGGPWQVWALERALREYSLVRATVGRGITSWGSGLEGPRESQVGASSLIRGLTPWLGRSDTVAQ